MWFTFVVGCITVSAIHFHVWALKSKCSLKHTWKSVSKVLLKESFGDEHYTYLGVAKWREPTWHRALEYCGESRCFSVCTPGFIHSLCVLMFGFVTSFLQNCAGSCDAKWKNVKHVLLVFVLRETTSWFWSLLVIAFSCSVVPCPVSRFCWAMAFFEASVFLLCALSLWGCCPGLVWFTLCLESVVSLCWLSQDLVCLGVDLLVSRALS